MRQRLAEQEFKQLLKDKTNNIEILLQEQLPQNPSLQKTIFDAMEYLFSYTHLTLPTICSV